MGTDQEHQLTKIESERLGTRNSISRLLAEPDKMKSFESALSSAGTYGIWRVLKTELESGNMTELEVYEKLLEVIKDIFMKLTKEGLKSVHPLNEIKKFYESLAPFLDLQSIVDEAFDYFLANEGDTGYFVFFLRDFQASNFLEKCKTSLREILLKDRFVGRTGHGIGILTEQGFNTTEWMNEIIRECVGNGDLLTAYRIKVWTDTGRLVRSPKDLTLEMNDEQMEETKKLYLKDLITNRREDDYTKEGSSRMAKGLIDENPAIDFSGTVNEVFVECLRGGEFPCVTRAIEAGISSYSKLVELIEEGEIEPYRSLINQYSLQSSDSDKASNLKKAFREEYPFLKIEGAKISPKALQLMEEYDLPLIWQHHLLSVPTTEVDPGFDPEIFLAKSNGEKAEYLWHYLRQTPVLDEQEKINYEKGAAIFGHGVMQIYTGMGNKGRFHESLQEIDGIIDLYEQSELSAKDFGGSILAQIGVDESSYGGQRRSWNYMANIVQELVGADLQAILDNGRDNAAIEEIATQIRSFDSISDIFKNWKSLKQFYELAQTLKNTELIDRLAMLKQEGESDPAKAALYKYVTTLGFHPHISLNDVLTFMDHPEDFLDREARFTDYNVHQKLAPGRYINMPHMDLFAEDMRDALVSGELEEMQSFPTMEMEFSIPADPEYARLNALSVPNLIKEAAGSHSERTKGKAKQPGQILGEVGGILFRERSGKERTLAIELVQGKLNPPLTPQEEKEIKERILFTNMGFGFKKGESDKVEEFKAMVTQKSDPLGVVAGNDMANCMPFGDGKTTQYTYSPACNFFLVQRKNTKGEWRTVSQALLTENRKVSQSPSLSVINEDQENQASPILKGLKNTILGHSRLNEVLDESLLNQNTPSIVNADSIEVANNFIATEAEMREGKDHRNIENLQLIYSKFFSTYLPSLRQRAAEEGRVIDDSQLITTANHNFNPFNGLEKIPNDSLPITTLGYLDNNLTVAAKIPINPKTSNTAEVKQKGQQVEPLTWRDSLQVAWIQERAYAENPSLDLGVAEMQNSLIAQAINNKHKDRPNMSLKYVDGQGMMRGYLNAYEGRTKDQLGSLYQDSPIIYIENLARDPGNNLAGGRLILKFLELYKQNYIDADNATPIYGEFRDQTSYKIVENSLDRMAKKLGKSVRREDVGDYNHGNDTMHRIIFFVE